MGLGRTYSVALVGLNGYIVEVEADIGQTLPAFVILGLPDASLNEAKERIRSAAQNSGIPLSRRKITANLIPASLPKRGSGFDLAIAMAVLLAADDVRPTGRTVFIAELGLDGRLRPVRGILPAVMAAVQAGFPDVVVAQANAAEAELVPGASVRGYATLARLACDFGADPQDLCARLRPPPDDSAERGGSEAAGSLTPDMSDVSGQADARRALEVAAAGAHHLLLTGPPGAGKTMLAERLPGLLPDLGDTEAMEVTAIHSLCATDFGISPAAAPPARMRIRTIPRPWQLSSAAARDCRGPERRPAPTGASCSSMRHRNMSGGSWTPSGSLWRAANWSFTDPPARLPTPHASSWSSPPTPAPAERPPAKVWTAPAPR